MTSGSGWIAVYSAVSSTTMIAATAAATLAPNDATGPSSFDGIVRVAGHEMLDLRGDVTRRGAGQVPEPAA